MSNFVTLFKTEIGRLAKKEVRADTKALKKSAAQYRSEIAELKRRISTLEGLVKKLAKGSPQPKTVADTNGSVTALRFRSGGFASLRQKLGLSAAEMGRLLGVSGQSVYHWESGKSRPRPTQLQAIAAIRKLSKREVAARLAQA